MDGTIEATTTKLQVIGYDFLTPLLMFIFGKDGIFMSISYDDGFAVAVMVWNIFVITSYVISFILLVIYVYAAIHYNELNDQMEDAMHAEEEAYARKRQGGATASRFADMKAHIASDNPNDWKLAIIEADIILDEALKRQGYAGTSLGERLRSISPQSLHSLDDAWQAHKVRNEIAHSGADFVLTQKLAAETIVRYERVFEELGLMSGGGSHH